MDNVCINYDNEIIKCDSKIIDKNNKKILHLDISSVSTGRTTIAITGDDLSKEDVKAKKTIGREVYVHRFGIITADTYFGRCKGDTSFILSLYIMFFLIIVNLIRMYIKDSKEKLYSY